MRVIRRDAVPRVVLATVGHNEAERLEGTLLGLQEASQPGDQVWFVDSGSTDRSVELAKELGVPSVLGPVGKGAAMSLALSSIPFSEWILFLDGDLGAESLRVASALRAAAEWAEPGLIVGQFWADEPSLLPSTDGVYGPLVDALFPEVNDRFGTRPLSGFRALSRTLEVEPPQGFGVEAFLNISTVLKGFSGTVVDVGRFQNPFRFKPRMPFEIAATILDLAESEGRLSTSLRHDWEVWIDGLFEPLSTYRGEAASRGEMVTHLRHWLARPRPG